LENLSAGECSYGRVTISAGWCASALSFSRRRAIKCLIEFLEKGVRFEIGKDRLRVIENGARTNNSRAEWGILGGGDEKRGEGCAVLMAYSVPK